MASETECAGSAPVWTPWIVLLRHGRPRRSDYEALTVLAGSRAQALEVARRYMGKRTVVVSVRQPLSEAISPAEETT